MRRMLLAGLLASDSTTVDQNKRFDWPIMHLDQSRRLENLPALKMKINSLVRNEHKITLNRWLKDGSSLALISSRVSNVVVPIHWFC